MPPDDVSSNITWVELVPPVTHISKAGKFPQSSRYPTSPILKVVSWPTVKGTIPSDSTETGMSSTHEKPPICYMIEPTFFYALPK